MKVVRNLYIYYISLGSSIVCRKSASPCQDVYLSHQRGKIYEEEYMTEFTKTFLFRLCVVLAVLCCSFYPKWACLQGLPHVCLHVMYVSRCIHPSSWSD